MSKKTTKKEAPKVAAKDPTPKKEVKPKKAAPKLDKLSARVRVEMAWVKANGGGHPPAPLWESLTTELANGGKTEEEIKAMLVDMAK